MKDAENEIGSIKISLEHDRTLFSTVPTSISAFFPWGGGGGVEGGVVRGLLKISQAVVHA